MEADEDDEEPTAAMAASNVIAYINNMNKEELIAYLEENLGDEFDPEHIREQLSGEEVEEYKRLLIAAMIPQQDGEEQQEEEESNQEEVLNEPEEEAAEADEVPAKVMATMTCDEMVAATMLADQIKNEAAKASSPVVVPIPEKPKKLEEEKKQEQAKKHDRVDKIDEHVKKKKKKTIIDDDDEDDEGDKDDVVYVGAKIEPPTKKTISEIAITIKKEKEDEKMEEEDVVHIKQEKISTKDVVVKSEKDKDREKDKEREREKKKKKKRDRERRELEREKERKKQEKEKDSKNLDNKPLLDKVKIEKQDKAATEESSLLVSDNAKHKSLDNTQIDKEEKSDKPPTISVSKSVKIEDQVEEEITFPPKKLKLSSDTPFVDPDFHKYQKKFKLKMCKLVLYDIKKQSCHWTEGDKVYRAQVREERRHAKKNKDKHGHGGGNANPYKYNERGSRVLDFEKRPESDRKKQREKFREIVREKPKTEAEKPNLFEVLHKNREKEMREKEEKRQKKLKMEFRIPIIKTEKDKPKETKHHSRYQEPVTTTTPSRQNKLKFDTRPLVTSTQRNDTWSMTPEEMNAMKKQELRATIPDDDFMGPSGGDGFSVHDDDNLVDMKDDTGSGADNPDSPGPPLIEISSDVNDVALNVLRLIETGQDVSPPREHASPAEVVEKKIAKWELNNQKEPYFQAVADIPENEEEEFYTLINAVDVTDDDDESFYGNVSHPSGNGSDFLQDNEVSSSLDPDKADEYCGAGLLTARYRIGGTGTAGDKEDCFRLIFEVRRGFNYEKQNFQAKCNLCQGEFINGKRHLGAHVRSSRHRQNLAKLSLSLIGMDAKLSSKDASKEVSRQRSSDSSYSSKNRDTKDKECSKDKDQEKEQDKNKEKTKLKVKEEKDRNGHKVSATVGKDDKRLSKHDSTKKDGSGSSHTTLPPTRVADASRTVSRKRSRSRSRSPRARYADRTERSRRDYDRSRHHRGVGGRSRSRSPHHGSRSRRTSSKDRVEAFLARNERSSSRRTSPPAKVMTSKAPRTKQDDNMIFKEKLTLQANGKWTPELEGRWKSMEDDEEQLKRLHTLKKRLMEEKPEEHPQYATEWEKFWERRYRELIDLGKTTEYADSYDYTTEWKEEWGKLTQTILQTEYDTRLHEIRIKYGMDLDTLKALNAPSRVPIVVASHGNAPSYIPSGHATLPAASFALNPPPPGVSIDDVVYTSATNFPAPVPAPTVVTTFLNVGQAGVYPSLTPRQPLLNDSLMTSVDRNAPVVTNVLNKDTSIRNVDGVDYTPKSMSISDGGSIKSGSVKDAGPSPKVTVDDIKSTWLNLTGQKISAAVAEAASKSGPPSQTAGSASGSSSKEYDYDGFDVVQVLRLMCGLEDELSFLAPKVQESYRQAESMELEEGRSSFSLLKDREFVTLLFQCRDKFNSILRANVSTSEVMRKLNLTVYGMNALLDSPSCQKLRPTAATSISLAVDTTRQEPTVQKPTLSMESNVADMASRKRDAENPIAAALSHLPMATKVALSSVVASSLIAQGKDRLSDSELLTNLLKIFAPIIANSVRESSRSSSTGEVAYKKGNFERGLSANDEMTTNRNRNVPAPSSSSLPFKNDGFSYDRDLDRPRGGGIGMQSGRSDPIPETIPSRTTYSAIPPLPEFHARAVSPPAHKKFAMQQQAQQSHGQNPNPLFVPNPLANPRHHGGGGSGRPPSPYDGRRPPAPLDQIMHEEESHKKKRKRRSGSIHKSKKRHKRNKKRRDSPPISSPSLIEQRRSSHDYKGRRSRSKSSEYDPIMHSKLSCSGSSSVISNEIVRSKRHHRSRNEKKKYIAAMCDDHGEKSGTLKDSKIAGVSKTFWDSEKLAGASSCVSSEENFYVRDIGLEEGTGNAPPPSGQEPCKPKCPPSDKTKYRKTGTIPGEINPDDSGDTKEPAGDTKEPAGDTKEAVDDTKEADGDAEEGEIISSSDTDFSNPLPRDPSPVGSNISFHVDTNIVNSYLFPRRSAPVPSANFDRSRVNPLPTRRPSPMGSDISENWDVGVVETNSLPRRPSPVGSNVSENWDLGIVKNDRVPRCPSPVDSNVSENWDLGIVK